MRNIFSLCFILLTSYLLAQNPDLYNEWILDKITYENGDKLEINHHNYSNFLSYTIKPNLLISSHGEAKASINEKYIKTQYRKIFYELKDGQLIFRDSDDNKLFYFLIKEDYLANYPEFKLKPIEHKGQILIESNRFCQAKKSEGFCLHEFLTNKIPSYKQYSVTNQFFEAQFVLTKENKIKDIEILSGISKSFDRQFISALLKAEGKLENDCNQDLLMTENFIFVKMGNSYVNRDERALIKTTSQMTKDFDKNLFKNVVDNYPQILNLKDKTDQIKRFNFSYENALLISGISFLALNRNEKACEAFELIGDKTNFKVRNYLIDFCGK